MYVLYVVTFTECVSYRKRTCTRILRELVPESILLYCQEWQSHTIHTFVNIGIVYCIKRIRSACALCILILHNATDKGPPYPEMSFLFIKIYFTPFLLLRCVHYCPQCNIRPAHVILNLRHYKNNKSSYFFLYIQTTIIGYSCIRGIHMHWIANVYVSYTDVGVVCLHKRAVPLGKVHTHTVIRFTYYKFFYRKVSGFVM